MGFLSKLFGGGNGESGMESAPAPLAGETGMPILRTAVRGGYDKRETLMMFDQLTTEKIMLEEALKAKDGGAPFRIPPEASIITPSRVKMGGFNEDDVNEYAEQLAAENASLRARLI
ncbi:hypothetical protein [Ruminococcus albus]|uniref:Uncharacterized protein n=1 Tax=Ruminococcus albus TaxID=1264 RepID=A0A1I1IM47_RUMAL|nr:hypothetical protein [Ruminococcus albus]SFC37297.1 hypothetical protein SAMN02910406_01629 [Ruminococcus albus]